MKERAESTEKMLNDEFRKLEESVNRELTLYFIPLVALFLSWLFLDEQFTFLQGVGFIVTVLSVYFLNRKYSEE
ncbi:MbeB family mobilization protein [Escherichia coli]|uniref:MbeB family mobilization protein n=1 Tax=Escherichia coli TaxID=562 RepID=UPI001F375E10|nr:MbeB family mobilization protein [Escherichia coli]